MSTEKRKKKKDALIRRPFLCAFSYRLSVLRLMRGIILCMAVLQINGCDSSEQHGQDGQDEERSLAISGRTMGTTYNIKVYPNGDAPNESAVDISIGAEELKAKVQSELDSINAAMSTYKADSELSLLNRAEVGRCLPLSDPLYDVINASLKLSDISQGYFDVTVGPAVDAWGFGPLDVVELPGKERLVELRDLVGYQAIELNEEARCLTKKAQRRVDLSAIAKGYAVDRLVLLLRGYAFSSFLVEVGGEVWAEGEKPAGKTWRIAVEAPLKHDRRIHSALQLKSVGVASSGDYRNYYERDGKAYSHTIDPHTLSPVEHHLVSVTVLANSTMMADAWATALLAMGAEKGLDLAKQEGLAALLIERNSNGHLKSYQTAAIKPYLGND